MKNIHLLPTDKPSRLFKFANELHLDTIPKDYYKKYNIYITSDEKIKEGDVVIHNFGMGYELEIPCDSDNLKSNTRSKIILTTDQDLIADGVQAIDDEFLEWFVKNPSCESVEVEKRYSDFTVDPFVGYKIIIPQEEPKQETLEEAAKILYPDGCDGTDRSAEIYRRIFIEGAKWIAERMYSEEEVIELLTQRSKHFGTNVKPFQELLLKQDLEWFEQFKKK